MNFEFGHMARIEGERNLTRVVKYHTYVELLALIAKAEEQIAELEANLDSMYEHEAGESL